MSKNILKNLTCAALALFFISASLLLMITIHFQNKINSQIQNVSILKDIRYPTWGAHPNPTGSQFKQSFNLFALQQIDGKIRSTKSNISKVYEYKFEYKNTSFAQGNTGRLNFINKWQLKQITGNAPQQNIKTINLAADKVYNYDFYAPPQRKFAILYNYITQFLTNSFLEKFYTVYLHKYFFQDKDLVLETVFKPLGFTADKATQIYDHPQFGWATIDTFQKWVTLSLKGVDDAQKMQHYEELVTEIGLSSKQIKSLTFERSTLYYMISALNGTIKSKLMMPGASNFNYKCQKVSCTNQQLIAFQIASSFLTSDPLFASLNLNMGIKQLNSTFLADLEYQKFCDKNKGKFACMQKSNMVKFFIHNYLGDFQKMDLLWKNQNNYDFIQKEFDLSNNTAESVVKYVFYLYDNFIGKFDQVYAWSQTTYNNIEPVVMTYKNLFLVELYSRTYYNKFIDKKQVDCEKYFTQEYKEVGKIVCSTQQQEVKSWNFIKYLSAMRKFIKAYLYIGQARQQMSEELGLSYEELIVFFNNQKLSLFAKELKEVQSIFKASFGCAQNSLQMCTPSQLFCMQWGSDLVFKNLPINIFENKIKSINQWDTQNILKGLNPDFHAIIGKQKSVSECMQILSSNSNTGIFSFFNILNIAQQNYQSSSQSDVLKYASRNVMEINFNGILNIQSVESLFTGFKSDIITKKNKMNIQSGGAPWLEDKQKLVKTDNKEQIKNNELLLVPQFDTIDTGIYERDRTRQVSKVWGQTKSSSKYTVYRGKKTDDEGNEISVDIFKKYVTERKVEGTNMLGFHPNIEQGQNLKMFVNLAYQPMTLSYESIVSYEYPDQLKKPLQAYKYKLVMSQGQPTEGSFIGIQELNQNYFALSPESYAIVEPVTGLTLQLVMDYTIKSNPIYTKFLLDSADAIDLFSSRQFYKRKGLTEVQEVIDTKFSQQVLIITGVATISVALLATFVLFILYCRSRKSASKVEKSLLEDYSASETI